MFTNYYVLKYEEKRTISLIRNSYEFNTGLNYLWGIIFHKGINVILEIKISSLVCEFNSYTRVYRYWVSIQMVDEFRAIRFQISKLKHIKTSKHRNLSICKNFFWQKPRHLKIRWFDRMRNRRLTSDPLHIIF